jgi:hypothetical protein
MGSATAMAETAPSPHHTPKIPGSCHGVAESRPARLASASFEPRRCQMAVNARCTIPPASHRCKPRPRADGLGRGRALPLPQGRSRGKVLPTTGQHRSDGLFHVSCQRNLPFRTSHTQPTLWLGRASPPTPPRPAWSLHHPGGSRSQACAARGGAVCACPRCAAQSIW